jgi:hypothetical protein
VAESPSVTSEELWRLKPVLRGEDVTGFTVKLEDGTVLGRIREKKEADDIGYLILDDADHKTHLLPGGLVEDLDKDKKSATVPRSLEDVQQVIATTGGRRERKVAGDVAGLPFSS